MVTGKDDTRRVHTDDEGGTATRRRGQAFTLEAVAAALLLLASLLFALQATAVTPLSTSTANQQIQNQETGLATGVLDAAVANASVKPSLLYWNDSGGRFHGATDDGSYPNGGPPTEFGRMLNATFDNRSIAFNVNVLYLSASGDPRTEPLVHLGTPSDDAVRTTRTVTLLDTDVLYDADETPTNTSVTEAATFYAPDAAPESPVYNVVRVEVIVWRT